MRNIFQSATFIWLLTTSLALNEFIPQINPGATEPSCAKGRSYCLEIDNYPRHKISELLGSASPELLSFFIDSDLDITYKGRNGPDGEFPVNYHSNSSASMSKRDEQLCQSIDRTIEPVAARDEKHQWRYIVNIPKSEQILEIEICKITDRKCNELTTNVLGFCEQKMMTRKLLALDPSGKKLIVHNAMLPSCCQCTLYDG